MPLHVENQGGNDIKTPRQDEERIRSMRFCETHSISRASFYNLLKSGKAPKIMKVGSRTLISAEAAAAWRVRMEAETAGAAA